MMFRFPDGSTKVIAWGQPVRGMIKNGMRPMSVMFPIEEVISILIAIENHVDLQNAQRAVKLVKHSVEESVAHMVAS